MRRTTSIVGPIVVACLLAAGPTPADSADFPEFERLRGHVAFWTDVYATWGLGQAAVHDLEHPAVVYEVVDLPGVVGDRYSDEQRDFLDEVKRRWVARLESLSDKVERRERLTDEEAGWALLLTTRAGTGAVIGAQDRVRTQRGQRERFRRGIEISSRYEARFREIFRGYGLPEDLAWLPHVESSFQAAARSSAGAVGIWQFTRGTGRHYMRITSAVDERLDPLAAAHGAAAYLKAAWDEFQDWPIALTSYNHGVAGMRRAVEKLGRDYDRIQREWDGRTFGFASRNFYAEFLAARAIAAEPGRFFPEGLRPEPLHDLEPFVLAAGTTADRLAEVFGLPLERLVPLNPAWTSRGARSASLLPEGLQVWLPPGTLAGVARAGGVADYAARVTDLSGGTHVVERGDTLSTIAATYRIGLHTLREVNGIPEDSSLIRLGQRLLVPSHGPAHGAAAHGTETSTAARHVVRAGETLSSIAGRYGTSVAELRRRNGIPARSSLIRPGQTLDGGGAAGAAARVHVVRRGESLIRIATRYRVTLGDLLLENELSERSIIHPGQSLRIPSPL